MKPLAFSALATPSLEASGAVSAVRMDKRAMEIPPVRHQLSGSAQEASVTSSSIDTGVANFYRLARLQRK
jgi:hypothetical protein